MTALSPLVIKLLCERDCNDLIGGIKGSDGFLVLLEIDRVTNDIVYVRYGKLSVLSAESTNILYEFFETPSIPCDFYLRLVN